MAFPRNSLRAFLQHARSNLVRAVREGHNINIVVGNESAGLLVHRPWHTGSYTDSHQTLTPSHPLFSTPTLNPLPLHETPSLQSTFPY